LKEEPQDRTLWRTQFGRGYRPVARQTTTWTWIEGHMLITDNKLSKCKLYQKCKYQVL
jgi:hypothetical protein